MCSYRRIVKAYLEKKEKSTIITDELYESLKIKIKLKYQ